MGKFRNRIMFVITFVDYDGMDSEKRRVDRTPRMSTKWMYEREDVFIDVHEELLPFSKVIELFGVIENEFSVKEYCNGSNAGGRWIFQIYSQEFIHELVDIVRESITPQKQNIIIAEVMSGDGRLSEFLKREIDQKIIATDAKTGRYNIGYPKWVQKMTAIETIQTFEPSLTIVSWEPYLSMASANLVESGIPLIWIGNPERCGHTDLFEFEHKSVGSPYAISRHDTFSSDERCTDVFLFNF
ncbi:MAG: hypothetical protein BAJATHORv1_50050 [Candidatus Thorarchaeota archaeon]|nr:MAG: hypothetical protein BAJATHORv1_50050 [Candidatus Thorarchaeota archaeon]